MKIAQVAPLIESVPPNLYGGTERIVSFLTEQLIRTGHDVTLFASGDSTTGAELVPCCGKAIRLNPEVKDAIPYHVMEIEKVRRRADEFDIIHFHTDLLHFPAFQQFGRKVLTTLHGRLDFPDLRPFFEFFDDVQLVSISNVQRRPLPSLNWLGTVYHGLPSHLSARTSAELGQYVAFLGRICPEKRPDRAIEISIRAGIPLKIAGKVDNVDRIYWEKCILPMVERNHDMIEYIGEIEEHQKSSFLQNALALLNPIDHPEPFGLVMIEAMACGTPVVAYRRGAVPEIVEHGVTGFIVETDRDAVEALKNIQSVDRKQVRQVFEAKFTIERMAKDYVCLYEELV